MEIVHGMLTRLWCSCGLVMCIGVLSLLIMRSEKEKKKEMMVIGWLCVLLGLGMGLWYSGSLLNPREQTVCATFLLDQKKTNVMPPMPATREYIFGREQGKNLVLYMDSYVKQELVPEGMERDTVYWVTYEDRTNLILEIQPE